MRWYYSIFLMKLILKNNKNKRKVIRFKNKGLLRYPLYDIVVTYKNLKNKVSIL